MPVFVAVLLTFLLAALLAPGGKVAAVPPLDQARLEALAVGLRTYHQAVMAYVGDQPTFSGTVVDADLATGGYLPGWFTNLGYAGTVDADGLSRSYLVAAPGGINVRPMVTLLNRSSEGYVLAGLAGDNPPAQVPQSWWERATTGVPAGMPFVATAARPLPGG